MGRRTRIVLALAPLTLLASVALAAPSEYHPPPQGCTSLAEGVQRVHVTWGRPAATQGCFFFSGPFDLGRDDQLGSHAEMTRGGAEVTLRFAMAIFEGRAAGDRLSLHRRSRHSFSGTWIVDEYIEGELTTVRRGGESCQGLRARYRYQEQQQGAESAGQCTISATLEVVGR